MDSPVNLIVPAAMVPLVAMAATAMLGAMTAHSMRRASASVATSCRNTSTAMPRASGPARVSEISLRPTPGPSCQIVRAHDGSSTNR